ncbi:MAG: secretin N-terminal domain-containing protein, partial [Aeoliella sp.]
RVLTVTDDDMDGEGSLLGPVRLEFIEGLDIIVIRGNPRDVARVREIINKIEAVSEETVPAIEVLPMQHVDSESMAVLLERVYSQVLGPRTGSVSITALGKPNALLLVGRPENVKTAIDLVKRLDLPVEPTTRFDVFPLEFAIAGDAKQLIDAFLADRETEGDDATPGILSPKAQVVADFRTNSLFVNAGPRDLVEIATLIQRIDVDRAAAVDEVRIFPLKNALATDMADVLRSAVLSDEEAGTQEGGEAASARVSALKFVTIDPNNQRRLESGILSNIRIAADSQANSLVVTAPSESMDLIAALIDQLDLTPDVEAEIKVFTVFNGDAVSLADMLRSLFGSADGGDEPGFVTGDNALVQLQLSVDARTNSIIAAGSTEDLAVVNALLVSLDASDVRARRTEVYRLKNSPAEDVAIAINQKLTSEREIESAAELALGPFEQIEREVVIVPELVSNSLIVSANPEQFDDISQLIEQLDARPPMVMIQVLIAEVRLNDTDEFGVELGLQDSLLFDRSVLDNANFNTIQTTTNTQSPGGQTITTTQDTIVNAPIIPGFNFNNQPLGNNASTSALAAAGNVATQGLSNFALNRVNSELGFGGFVFSASSNSVNMLLRALKENRRLEVLARPQIMALDNQIGEVNVGQRVPRIQSTSTTQFGQQNSIVYENVGIVLQVQPRISPDGMVVMVVHAEKSEVGSEQEGIPIFSGLDGTVIRAPRIDQTVADTTVAASTGQTVVLSGLLTKRSFDIHRRVPILADIPLLGDLFRFDSVSEQRTELLIVLTPRIVRSELDAEMIKQVESSRMSWVLCDAVDLHGPSGLRSRCDDWTDADSESVYPTHVPNEVEFGPTPMQGPEMQGPEVQSDPLMQDDTMPLDEPISPAAYQQSPVTTVPTRLPPVTSE